MRRPDLKKDTKIGAPHKNADKIDNQKYDNRRNIDGSEVWQNTPDRREHRFGRPVKKIADCCNEWIARIYNVERIKPGKYSPRNENENIDTKNKIYHR